MSIKLTDFLDLDYLQDIQDAFAEAFKLSAAITLPNGIPLTRISGNNPICAFLRKAHHAGCSGFPAELGKRLLENPMSFHCECPVCGFLVGTSPILINGEHLANWVVLQSARNEAGLEAKVQRIAQEKNFDPNLTAQALRDVPKASKRRLLLALTHSESLVRNLSNLAYNNMLLQRETAAGKRQERLLRQSAEHQQLLNSVMRQLLEQDLNTAVDRCLAKMGEILKLSGIFIFEDTPDGCGARLTHAQRFCGLPDALPPQQATYEEFPVLRNDLNIQGPANNPPFLLPPLQQQLRMFWGDVALFQQTLLMHGSKKGFITFVDADRERIWTQIECNTFANLTKILTQVLLRIHDEQLMTASKHLFETVLDKLNAWIYAIDGETYELLFVNAHMRRSFGDYLLGRKCWEVIKKSNFPCASCPHANKKNSPSEQSSYSFEFYSDILGCWMLKHGTGARWIDGRLVYLESDVDITETKQHEQLIEYMAWHDVLLDLPNRSRCQNDLHAYLAEHEQGSLICLDLDDFKVINDAFGHAYGDRILKVIAEHFRASPDFSGKVYRFGGDEFLLILPGLADQQVDELAEKLLARFRSPWLLDDHVSFCTASIGIVRFPKDGDTAQDLLRNVDVALFKAKNQGRNCITHFTSSQNISLVTRLETEQRLRLSVLDGCRDFKIYYQPIVDVGTKKWIGTEALVRWEDSGVGLISPTHFIPLTEYLGLIVPIGDHVLREACTHCKLWQDAGAPGFRVNVNLSIRQIHTENFISRVEKILQDTGLSPHCLTLEITESLAMQDMALVLKKLTELRKMGIKIAMDDFGTGYSSLATLRRIPLDILKIDRSFIQDLSGTKYNRAFLSTIVELARSLELSVCVEGVETWEQFAFIADAGCHSVQGYLFSPPLPDNNIRLELEECCRFDSAKPGANSSPR